MIWTLLLTIVSISTSAASASDVLCLGTCTETSANIVYFHGLESVSEPFREPRGLQLRNRKLLESAARSSNLCIALPEAPYTCRSGSVRCWNSSDAGAVVNETLENTRSTCFSGRPAHGLIGFSNGGFLLNQLYQECRLSEFTTLSVGADTPRPGPPTRSLRGCGSLTLQSSKLEPAGKGIVPYFRALAEKGAEVHLQLQQGKEHKLYPGTLEWLKAVRP